MRLLADCQIAFDEWYFAASRAPQHGLHTLRVRPVPIVAEIMVSGQVVGGRNTEVVAYRVLAEVDLGAFRSRLDP